MQPVLDSGPVDFIAQQIPRCPDQDEQGGPKAVSHLRLQAMLLEVRDEVAELFNSKGRF